MGSTTTITETISIDRPAADVWAVVADYGRDPEWRAGVETMAPSPAGLVRVGTTTAEVMRFAGRTLRNAGVVVSVEPGVRFEWRTTDDADASGARTVEPMGHDRCRVTLELVVRSHGVERLLRPLLAPMLRRGVAADVDRLRALVSPTRSERPAPRASA